MRLSSVIFDIGRVLVAYDWEDYLHGFGFEKDKEEALAHAMFAGPYWKELDRGVWSQSELLDAFTSLAPACRREIETVFSHAERCISGLAYAKPWIQELKSRGLHVYYLSNYSLSMRLKTSEALDFLDLMDGGLFSYEVNMVKPEPEIYRELLKRYPEIVPEQSVFLDDTEINVETARRLGMQSIIFRNFHQGKKDLEQML